MWSSHSTTHRIRVDESLGLVVLQINLAESGYMKRIRRFLLVMLSIMLLLQTSAMSGELTDAEFRRLHKLLQPDPDEAWRTIPWKIALLDAQQTAVKENKPIFIWAMDGHPLGCT